LIGRVLRSAKALSLKPIESCASEVSQNIAKKFDSATEIPPLGLFGRTKRRLVPHIFSKQEITDLLGATDNLHPRDGLRPLTYRAVFALLASCGLRIGEVTRLTRADVDLDCGVLSICGT
jgi:integrase